MSVMELNSNERMRINSRYQEVRRGNIHWVNLGNEKEKGEQGGIRPAMVIQNDVGNQYSPTVIISILSSQIFKCKLPTHVLITKDMCKGLTKDSFIATEQILTISKKKLGDYIGHVEDPRIDRAIEISLGLASVENKAVKIAKEKAEGIKSIDNFIRMWIAKGRDVQEILDEVKERKLRIKDLTYYCEVNKLNVSEYYDVECIKNGENKNIRLVG